MSFLDPVGFFDHEGSAVLSYYYHLLLKCTTRTQDWC